ncbi:hypothetical protein [Sporolactobacillus inulinus]|uniref:Integral membrane protein n=2 Tax=Sporolactobacillus inulinus TaxID=2078 RepID=A0A4Y1ZCB4_9BACL|nr:hypothetical protein [Sporolactobacillus inulinus]KLI02065.1 membrane protein [Sporolactobacillus inulinus CASD]GAY76742.1 hypothetical protein NBRC111894_2296 [Sporolactobacillus inulinus]GEB77475.1 hypothetical protein SIN01_18200 [Sporolactobacillus inulinus]
MINEWAWETLPDWFWAIYYFLFVASIVMAIVCFLRNRRRGLASVAFMFALTIPVVSVLGSIGRANGRNEFEHLYSQLLHGAVWAYYVTIGYVFLIAWWILLAKSIMKKR